MNSVEVVGQIPSHRIAAAGAIFRRLAHIARLSARAAALVLIVAPFATGTAGAQTNAHGTPGEAKALAERAAAHLRDVGPDRAVADFADPREDFHDRDLFVVVYDDQHKVMPSFGAAGLTGRDATRLVDTDGKAFGKELIHTAETEGTGWVSYRVTNPATMKVEAKQSYVIKVGEYVVFVGAYGS